MSKKAVFVTAAVVTALIMQGETESPGSTGRTVEKARDAAEPAAREAIGAAGDGLLIVREEAGRQVPAALPTESRDAVAIAGSG